MCIKREKKQHMERQVNNIHQYIEKISTMYVNNGHKTQGTRINVSQIERKEKKRKDTGNPHYIPQYVLSP